MRDEPLLPWVILLAGGGGTRFWPASRKRRPKQVLPLLEGSTRSLLRATWERALRLTSPERIVVVTAPEPAEAVRAELPEAEGWQIVVEPEPRNTAPAVALGTIRCLNRGGGTHDPVIVLPADTWMPDEDVLEATLRRATVAASTQRAIVLLSATADRPATGFGWIVAGDPVEVFGEGELPVRRVVRFVEKPPAEEAEALLAAGAGWNAGIFVFRLGYLWYVLGDLHESFDMALQPLSWCMEEGDTRGLAEEWARLPSISFDHAVLERAPSLLVISLATRWADLGSWDAVGQVLDSYDDSHYSAAGLVQEDARRNVVWAPGKTVALIGVQDLVVVATEDAILVMPRERAQEVRAVVARVSAAGRDDLL